MVDIARDARWGRIMEGSGEDPLLGSAFAAAYVRGYQSGGLLACAKHFAHSARAELADELVAPDPVPDARHRCASVSCCPRRLRGWGFAPMER